MWPSAAHPGLSKEREHTADPRLPAGACPLTSTRTSDTELPPAGWDAPGGRAASCRGATAGSNHDTHQGSGEAGTVSGPGPTWHGAMAVPPRYSPSPGTVESGSRARATRLELIMAGSVAASGRASSGPQPTRRSGSLAEGTVGSHPGRDRAGSVSTPTAAGAGVNAPQWRKDVGTGPGPGPWQKGLPLGFGKDLSAALSPL